GQMRKDETTAAVEAEANAAPIIRLSTLDVLCNRHSRAQSEDLRSRADRAGRRMRRAKYFRLSQLGARDASVPTHSESTSKPPAESPFQLDRHIRRRELPQSYDRSRFHR